MKCGVIALLGRPNTGKSSLINALLKTRAAIVSPKPQTTRNSVRCIYNDNNSQIIFVDTPGLYIPTHKKDRLGYFLADAALGSLKDQDIDAVIWLIDYKFNKLTPEDLEAAKALNEINKPVILAVNKVDEISCRRETLDNKFPAETAKLFEKLLTRGAAMKIALSAKFNFNINKLIESLKEMLPEGEPWYDPDILMDTTERFMASEIIRGKVLNLLRDEVPHCTAVEIEEYKSPDEYPVHDNSSANKLRERLYIRAALIVETDGQKAILIGAKGRMIKRIGQSARAELEAITGFKVYLELWVKVAAKWRQSDLILKRLGYA